MHCVREISAFGLLLSAVHSRTRRNLAQNSGARLVGESVIARGKGETGRDQVIGQFLLGTQPTVSGQWYKSYRSYRSYTADHCFTNQSL